MVGPEAHPKKPDMYAILRTLKLKSDTDIVASDNHCRRVNDRGTEHAHVDASLKRYNWTLHDKPLMELYHETMQEYDAIQPRKDSVKIVEMLMTISPEYFDDVNPLNAKNHPKITELIAASREFIDRLDGVKLLNLSLHVDEPGAAPHLHAHVVMLDRRKDGKAILNASKHLDGKKKLSYLQDVYHFSVSQRIQGVKRGISSEITKNKHIKAKDIRKSLKRLQDIGYLEHEINDILKKIIENARTINNINDVERLIEENISKNKGSNQKRGVDFGI